MQLRWEAIPETRRLPLLAFRTLPLPAKTLEDSSWQAGRKDPRLVSHGVVMTFADLLWNRVASYQLLAHSTSRHGDCMHILLKTSADSTYILYILVNS